MLFRASWLAPRSPRRSDPRVADLPVDPTEPTEPTEPSEPTVEILDVTPEVAEQRPSRKRNSRNLRGWVIDSYARDVPTGAWVLNGATVKVADLR